MALNWFIEFIQKYNIPLLNSENHPEIFTYNNLIFNILTLSSPYTEYKTNNIYIWQDQVLYFPNKVASRIFSKLQLNTKLPARVCKIKEIDKLTALNFTNENHLLFHANAAKYFGLFLPQTYQRLLPNITFENELLVAVMSFSDGLKFRNGDISYELIRYCSLLNINIQGGFGKLLTHFENTVKPDHIMTYIDRDWSSGDSFKKFGFEITDYKPSMFFKLNDKKERISVPSTQAYEIFNSGSVKLEKQIRQ